MKNELLIREVLNEKWIEPSRIDWIGNMFWYNKYGELHSTGDNPAEIYSIGTKRWFKNGLIHRNKDKPAEEYSNGDKYWFKNGECHRGGNKPAIIYSTGEGKWYKNGKLIK